MMAWGSLAFAENYTVDSPDSRITVNVETGTNTTYSVLSMSRENLYENDRPIHHYIPENTVCNSLHPVPFHYNDQWFACFSGALPVSILDFPDSLKVLNEEVIYCFPEDYNTLFPEERSMLSAQQPLFKPMKLSEIGTDRFCSTPILIKVDENARIFISESDLESYPGMFLRKQGKNELAGKFAAVSLEDYKTDDRQNQCVVPVPCNLSGTYPRIISFCFRS